MEHPPPFPHGAMLQVLALVLFRALPIVGYVATSVRAPLAAKVVLGVAYAFTAGALLPNGFVDLVSATGAYSWFLVMSYGVYRVSHDVQFPKLRKSLVFLACAVVFLFAPAIIASPRARPLVTVIGWELMLSAYSYLIETRESKRSYTLRESLFFLLVNPVLVFADRGFQIGRPRIDIWGLRRVVLGILAMLGAAVISTFPLLTHSHEQVLHPVVLLIPIGLNRFSILYLQHSGLASVQIGLLLQLGYRIPERYRHPLVATSPADFWRRWNTYIGRWTERYLFFPIAVNLARRTRMRPWLPKCLAVLVAFAGIGVLHDAFTLAQGLVATSRGLIMFSYFGTMLLAWIAAERALKGLTNRWHRSTPVLSRLGFWTVMGLSVSVGSRI